MFEKVPELSSDLEWMLQSGQATNEMLVEALVEAYYQPVYNLAIAILQSETAARLAARETFSLALLNVFRYRSAQGVHVWLYRLAWRRIRNRMGARPGDGEDPSLPGLPAMQDAATPAPQADSIEQIIDRMPVKIRIPLVLHAYQGWDPALIAQVLRLRESDVKKHLEAGYRAIHRLLAQPPDSFPASGSPIVADGILRESLAGILRERWPAADIPPEEAAATVAYVLSHTHRAGKWIRRLAPVKEVLLLVAAALVIAAFIWGVDTIAPESQVTPVPSRIWNPAGADLPDATPELRNRRTPPAKPTLTPTPKSVSTNSAAGIPPAAVFAGRMPAWGSGTRPT